MEAIEAQLAAAMPTDATPRITTLRDTTQGALAVLVHLDQYVVATMPHRRAIQQEEFPRELLCHVQMALGRLHELRHGTQRDRACCGRRIAWWRRSRLRKVAVLIVVKVAVLALAGRLVAMTGAWEAASFAPIWLAEFVFTTAVDAGLRDEVQWRLLTHCPLGSARGKQVLKYVLHGAALLITSITALQFDLSGRKFYVMLACFFALGIVLFWHGPQPPERRHFGALDVAIDMNDGLLRVCGVSDQRAVPLRCVRAFGASSMEAGDCFAPRELHFVTAHKHAPWEREPLRVSSLYIAQRIALALDDALRLWRAVHDAPTRVEVLGLQRVAV